MHPVVSVIIPFKNAAEWFHETLLSIQSQSYRNWEVIGVNDHSTDESAAIFNSFCGKDARFRFIQNTHTGIIAALQTGMEVSRGEYITRMDADDLMPVERLFRMVQMMQISPPKTVVTGSVQYVSKDGIPVSEGYLNYERWLNERIQNRDHWNHIYRECVIASPNWMTRKQDLTEDNIFNELRYPEDYDMVLQWKYKGYTIEVIPEITLCWREHSKRTSRNSAVYQQRSFFQLKIDWFCRSEWQPSQTIAILGAGTKGKLTARILISKGVHFQWHDLNAEKFTSPIYQQAIVSYEELSADIVLIAVYPRELGPLMQFLHERSYTIGKNAWFL